VKSGGRDGIGFRENLKVGVKLILGIEGCEEMKVSELEGGEEVRVVSEE